MKRRRDPSESESEEDEHGDLLTLDRQGLTRERNKAERRLDAIAQRERELDGHNLHAKAAGQIQDKAWYRSLDMLVLPGCGDAEVNTKMKPFLSAHLSGDACNIVFGYAMQTVAEACKELLDGMKIVRNAIQDTADGFSLTIRVGGKVCIRAWHTEEPDPAGIIGPDLDTKIAMTTSSSPESPYGKARKVQNLRQVARELGMDGVVPLIILASILFYPIALACNEVADNCGSHEERMTEQFRIWLMSSQERDAGVFHIEDEEEDELSDQDEWHPSQTKVHKEWILIKDKKLSPQTFGVLSGVDMS